MTAHPVYIRAPHAPRSAVYIRDERSETPYARDEDAAIRRARRELRTLAPTPANANARAAARAVLDAYGVIR